MYRKLLEHAQRDLFKSHVDGMAVLHELEKRLRESPRLAIGPDPQEASPMHSVSSCATMWWMRRGLRNRILPIIKQLFLTFPITRMSFRDGVDGAGVQGVVLAAAEALAAVYTAGGGHDEPKTLGPLGVVQIHFDGLLKIALQILIFMLVTSVARLIFHR